MPELPEVETTRRGIAPHVQGHTVKTVTVREYRLRWPIPADLGQTLTGQTITSVDRRAKYLLFGTATGTALIHLGMSGSLRLADSSSEWRKHDHVELAFDNNQRLRLHDPRRFGALLWTTEPPADHPLLCRLGPEPLGPDFTAEYLHTQAAARRVPVKQFIMDGHVVVGVGNIYASEALFLAGIHPLRAANNISFKRYARLVETIRQVLSDAITQGGTTLRDFVNGVGEPGYFQQSLNVYERRDQPCRRCASAIKQIRLGQRSTYYCPRCQR